MKGTIFEKSTTSLHQWFYAMYLMASTRCGISAKQLERELGVTYKTAHRVMKRVRMELMHDMDDEPLSGDVEIDETSWGGKARRPMDRFEAAAWREAKPTVLGMVERGDESVPASSPLVVALRLVERCWRTSTRPRSSSRTTGRPTNRCDGPTSTHRVINHSEASTGAETRTRTPSRASSGTGMRGAYKKVSLAYLQSYVDECAWRYNARHKGRAMFEQLIQRAANS
jgi:hypothetical protein